jgi:hypothetical protein
MWRPINLPDYPPPNSSTLFAAQAWHELLSPQSPDTFQARALDLPTLLEEVTEVASLSSEDERWRAHLPDYARARDHQRGLGRLAGRAVGARRAGTPCRRSARD